MPRPLAICIENCYPQHESLRYLRCTAITGVDPGLAVTPGGEVVWRGEGPVLCEIWVSADDKLICFRPPGALAGARVHRAGREVNLEENKPVVVISGDYLLLPHHCYRIHVHGEAPAVAEPKYLDFEEPASSTWSRLAVAGALALGTLVVPACTRPLAEETKPVEVRDSPPQVAAPDPPPMEEAMPPDPVPMEVRDEPPKVMIKQDPPPPPPPPPPPDKSDAGVPDEGGDMKNHKPIEVRPVPPSVAAPMIQPKPPAPPK